MININRRYFIRLILASLSFVFMGSLFYKLRSIYNSGYSINTIFIKIQSQWRYQKSLTDNEKQSIKLYIDCLIPDDITPGALSMGIEKKFFLTCEKKPYKRKIVREGLMRINQLSMASNNKKFYTLDNEQADHILLLSEKATPVSPEKVLFDMLRNDTFTNFYSNPEHWAALCYKGPPQPGGFLNQHLSPEICST